MKYYKHTFIFLIAVAFGLTSGVCAQETQTIEIGPDAVVYTETFDDIENATSYYNEDVLVLTEYDSSENGSPDTWILYREDYSVSKEMRDSDADGSPDIFFEFDSDEKLVNSSGEGLKQYEAETPVQSTDETNTGDTNVVEEKDYAGDLTDIKKLAGESGGFGTWIIILLAVGGVYLWFKKRKQ